MKRKRLKVGCRVKMLNKRSPFFGREGTLVAGKERICPIVRWDGQTKNHEPYFNDLEVL